MQGMSWSLDACRCQKELDDFGICWTVFFSCDSQYFKTIHLDPRDMEVTEVF